MAFFGYSTKSIKTNYQNQKKMKMNNLAKILCCLLFCLNLPAQTLTQSDFLKADGTVLRNNSGTGSVINLRGTNLGSWLSMEYWMRL